MYGASLEWCDSFYLVLFIILSAFHLTTEPESRWSHLKFLEIAYKIFHSQDDLEIDISTLVKVPQDSKPVCALSLR